MLTLEIICRFVGMDETQYNLLYTVYSIPNIILPFFGALLPKKGKIIAVEFTLLEVHGRPRI